MSSSSVFLKKAHSYSYSSDEANPTPNPKARNTEGRELESGQADVGNDAKVGGEDRSHGDDLEDDGPWYIGKAKEEYKRRYGNTKTNHRGGPTEDEDPIQWARDRQNAERERESDFGPDDYFDGALRGGNREGEEIDEFGETMILVALCLMVSVLLYVRTRLVDRLRREDEGQGGNGQQQQQQGQAPPPPAFPPAGDPARDEWRMI